MKKPKIIFGVRNPVFLVGDVIASDLSHNLMHLKLYPSFQT